MGDKAITTLKGRAMEFRVRTSSETKVHSLRTRLSLLAGLSLRTGLSYPVSLVARQAWFKDPGPGQAETPNRTFLSWVKWFLSGFLRNTLFSNPVAILRGIIKMHAEKFSHDQTSNKKWQWHDFLSRWDTGHLFHQIEQAVVSEGNHVSLSAGSQGLRDSASLAVVACAFLTCSVFLIPGKSEAI